MTTLSEHAVRRARQRGIGLTQIDAILTFGDCVAQRGGGAEYIWISYEMMKRLGPTTPDGLNTRRLQDLHILIAADGTVITVVRACGRRCRVKF